MYSKKIININLSGLFLTCVSIFLTSSSFAVGVKEHSRKKTICQNRLPGRVKVDFANAESTIYEDELFFILAGLRSREANAHSIMAYWVDEQYSNHNTILSRTFDKLNGSDLETGFLKRIVQAKPKVTKYFFAAEEEKARYESRSDIGWIERKLQYINTYDGERFYHWNVGSHTAVSSTNLERWDEQGSQMFQTSIGPSSLKLSEVITEQKARVVGKQQIGGYETIEIEATNSSAIQRWFVAPKLDCLVIRYETVSREAKSSEPIVSWRYVETVEKASRISGVYIPLERRAVKFLTVRVDSTQKPQEIWQILNYRKAVNVTVNSPLPAALFSIILPPATKILKMPESETDQTLGTQESYDKRLSAAQQKKEAPDFSVIDTTEVYKRVSQEKFTASWVQPEGNPIIVIGP